MLIYSIILSLIFSFVIIGISVAPPNEVVSVLFLFL